MRKDGMYSLMIMTSSKTTPKKPNLPANHYKMHSKILLIKILSNSSENVFNGTFISYQKEPIFKSLSSLTFKGLMDRKRPSLIIQETASKIHC